MSCRSVLCVQVLLVLILTSASTAFAQEVPPPNRRIIFEQDNEAVQNQLERKRKQVLRRDAAVGDSSRFSAGSIEFDQTTNEMVGTEGISLSRPGVSASADSARYNRESGDLKLKDGVRFSWPGGTVQASQASFNVEKETGRFTDADLLLEEGEFRVQSRSLRKVSEFEYKLGPSEFSTCNCEDGTVPWSVLCSGGSIQQGGYAHIRNTRVLVNGTPVFYTPYLLFPVKTERASGLLVPQFGYGNRDGTLYWQPIFGVIDDSTDVTLTPFIESQSRVGASVEFRKVFSERSNLDFRLLFSDESRREGGLRGTRVDDIFDPEVEDDRFGGYYRQNWRTDDDVAVPSALIIDGHYVSDPLFPREIQDEEIARPNTRFVSSRAVFRSSYKGVLTGEVSSEYNQALLSDPDLTFNRLPEGTLSVTDTFRPLGYNPFGIKLVAGLSANAVRFDRDRGFEGTRTNLSPTFGVPWHIKNFLNGQLSVTGYATRYNLSSDEDPNDPNVRFDDDRRNTFQIQHRLSTAIEKVYEVDKDSTLAYLTNIGSRNQQYQLERVKHTIEPEVTYQYAPDEDQSRVPLFDALDRIRSRNLIGVGIRSRLLGRFSPRYAASDTIPEVAPELESIPSVSIDEPFRFFGDEFNATSRQLRLNRGEIRELASMLVQQNFDYDEDREDRDPTRSGWSDVQFAAGVFPTRDLGFSFSTNYNVEDQDVNSWTFGTHLTDDRGDSIRARYSYIENQLSQVETGLELVLSDRIRIGGYARFDEEESEFIESNTALRFLSDCRCWSIDLGYTHTVNPDRDRVLFTVNLLGLGGITQRTNLDSLRRQ